MTNQSNDSSNTSNANMTSTPSDQKSTQTTQKPEHQQHLQLEHKHDKHLKCRQRQQHAVQTTQVMRPILTSGSVYRDTAGRRHYTGIHRARLDFRKMLKSNWRVEIKLTYICVLESNNISYAKCGMRVCCLRVLLYCCACAVLVVLFCAFCDALARCLCMLILRCS